MKKMVAVLVMLLVSLMAYAQAQLSRSYAQKPLSEVLADIDKSTNELNISFIYNKLEDYLVTCTLTDEAPYDAILKVIGFYPVKVTRHENTILIEPVYDTESKFTGRILDETGQPLEFVNVALYSLSDGKLLASGVTTANGDFVIPCEMQNVLLEASLVGYKTVKRECTFAAIGTISMEPSMQYKLDESVITSDVATTSAEKTSYFPSRSERNAAMDATSLLQQMMIPQLRINPASGYITTLSGESVSIFIDYILATREDLEGMNTQDVKRVEIYDFPSDVRFHNKPHVINFVMQKYEYGGYTKLRSAQMVLADFTTNNIIYSKLSLKDWTLDANLTGRYAIQKHLGAESVETFNLPEQTITRTEFSENGTQKNIKSSASFRATCQNEKMQISNRIGFLDGNTPLREIFGTVSYAPDVISTTSTESRRTERSLTPSYNGDWYFALPKDWSLFVSPSFQYARNKQKRFYRETAAIENNIIEDAYKAEWVMLAGKTFAQKHKAQIGIYGFDYSSRLDYKGSTNAHQDMNYIALGIPVIYQFSAEKFNVEAQVVATYERNDVNDEILSKWAPMASLVMAYAFGKKSSLEAEFGIGLSGANGAERNPSVMQENELLYYCGNPLLENYNSYLGKLQYNWMPSNLFTSSAFVQHYYNRNYFANVWDLYGNGAAVIRHFDNVGDANITNLGASLTFRLLDGSLQLSANPELSLIRISGRDKLRRNPFNISLNASYYIGQFYINGSYTAPAKNYLREDAVWQVDRSFYYLTAGWGNSKWKLKFDFVNIGRTDWRGNRSEIKTPYYTQHQRSFNASSHQRINFTLTYTFGYGKKVTQSNELGSAIPARSSIL